MTSSSALLDPLAAQDAVPDVVCAPVAAAVRGERVAPDVRGELGAEAVRIVRAGGFIAAIEPVVSDVEPEGTVIAQDPSPGVRVERETVLTLRLATLPESRPAPQSTGEEERAEEPGVAVAAQDDTEEWFATLAGTRCEPAGEPAQGRRRRKHREPQAPVSAWVFDTSPEPLAMPRDRAGIAPVERGGPGTGAWPLLRAGASVFGASVTRLPWWRVAAVLAGVLVCVVIGMRAYAPSGQSVGVMNRGVATARAPIPVQHARVARISRRPRGASPRPRKRTVRHSRFRAVSRMPRAPRDARSPAVASAPSPSATEAAVPRPAPRAASNQFAYLGR